jgi:hypothetical protein
MNRTRIEDILISYTKPNNQRRSRINLSKPRLPKLSHKASKSNLVSFQKLNPSNQSLIQQKKDFSEGPKERKYNKLKNISCSQDDFERLDFLSNQNHLIRNNSINIQEQLIGITSGVKLPSINKVNLEKSSDSKLSFHINSVLEKYEMDLKKKLKGLERCSN